MGRSGDRFVHDASSTPSSPLGHQGGGRRSPSPPPGGGMLGGFSRTSPWVWSSRVDSQRKGVISVVFFSCLSRLPVVVVVVEEPRRVPDEGCACKGFFLRVSSFFVYSKSL